MLWRGDYNMIPIKEMLNKIKWNMNLNPDNYTVLYKDFDQLKEIKYKEIKKIDGIHMELANDIVIPLHRIKQIKFNGNIVWKRK